jgi:hypothetical protein
LQFSGVNPSFGGPQHGSGRQRAPVGTPERFLPGRYVVPDLAAQVVHQVLTPILRLVRSRNPSHTRLQVSEDALDLLQGTSEVFGDLSRQHVRFRQLGRILQ